MRLCFGTNMKKPFVSSGKPGVKPPSGTWKPRLPARLPGQFSRNGETTILSLGGGTIENPPAMASLKQIKGTRIYLRADEEMLYKRIMAKGHPPFLGQQTPREDFSRLVQNKRPPLHPIRQSDTHRKRHCTGRKHP